MRPVDAILLKIAAYDEGLSRLGKQEFGARGILNFARAEMLDVLKAIAMEARQGPDPKGLDGGAATARAEGIAQ